MLEEKRMPDDNVESLTPAEVAELLGIPPSTLRTYAAAFGDLLSRGAQGDPAVAGRAFRHRRYTRADLRVLSRAKTLVDGGLSYQVARAQLSDDGPAVVERHPPVTRAPRGSASTGPRMARAAAWQPPPPNPAPSPPPGAAPFPIPETRVRVVADPAAGEAIQHLAGVVRRLVDAIEETNARIGRVEERLEALQMYAQRSDSAATTPAPRPSWFHRLIRRDRAAVDTV